MQRIRWPKNYSPWAAASDSDSDASLAASTSPLPAAKRAASPGRPITGVYLFCVGDQFQPSLSPPSSPTTLAPKPLVSNTMALATVPQADAIFATAPLALSVLLGVPLLARRLSAKPALALPRNAHYDNDAASALHIDPATGRAPAEWARGGVGTVLIVRADQQPLTKDLLARIVAFSRACAGRPGEHATPSRFADFCAAAAADDELELAHPRSQAQMLPPIAAGPPLAASQLISRSQVLGESWLDVNKSQVSV